MRISDKNRLQVLRRVRDYLQPLAKDPALAVSYAELEGVIVRLTDEGARQDGHRRQAKIGTDTVELPAATLRNDLLRPVVHLVKIVTPDAVWVLARTRDSHQQFKHPSKPSLVTLAGSGNDDLAPGTFNSILKQAGLKDRGQE